MCETLIELAHTYMGEFAYGMYRKRVYGGPASGTYSGGGKRARAAAPLTAKVKALQRKVALLSPETKLFSNALTITNVTDIAGSISYLCPIVQGNTDSSRIGDKIRASMLKMRFRVAQFEAANVSANSYCFTLILDKESSGTIPVISGTANSIFTSFTPRTNSIVQSLTSDRFKILKQKYISANGLNYGVGGGNCWDWTVPLNKVMTYNATGGTVADASQNQLYLVVTTSDLADVLDLDVDTHLYFTDI